MKDDKMYKIIREKAEKTLVPSGLEPAAVEKKCREIKQKRKTKKWPVVSGVAAAVLLVVCLQTWNTIRIHQEKKGGTAEKYQIAMNQEENSDSSGGSYDEIFQCVKMSQEETTSGNAKTQLAEDTAVGSQPSGVAHSNTDLQVEGVEESDVIKTDGQYIYVLQKGAKLVIYQADGKKTTKISSVTIGDASEENSGIEMYLQDDQAFVLKSVYKEKKDSYETRIYTVDLKDQKHPVIEGSISQSGELSTSRLVDGYLYVFSGYGILGDRKVKEDKKESYVPKVNDTCLEASDIYYEKEKAADRYMVMTSIKLSDPLKYADQKATLSQSDVFYVSHENIYMVDNHIEYDDCTVSYGVGGENASLQKYTYEAGTISYVKKADLKGIVSETYNMHENNGNFVYVYTDYTKEKTVTGLCILDKDLKTVGEIKNLGKGEDLKASYFIDHTAYFVTYLTKDPVFVVDFSDPGKPVQKQKLKLPGFSRYLHSFGSENMIGLGYTDDGKVKLTLFAKDEENMLTEVDTVSEKKESFTSEYDHKSVFVDEEKGLVGFYVNEYGKSYYKLYENRSGKWKLKVNERCKTDNSYDWVARGVTIGDVLYVAEYGTQEIKTYDIGK